MLWNCERTLPSDAYWRPASWTMYPYLNNSNEYPESHHTTTSPLTIQTTPPNTTMQALPCGSVMSSSVNSLPSLVTSSQTYASDFDLHHLLTEEEFFAQNTYEEKATRSHSFGGTTQFSSMQHEQQLILDTNYGFQSHQLGTIYGSLNASTSLYDSGENLGSCLGASSATSMALVHSPDGAGAGGSGNNTFSPGGMSSPVMNGVPASGASDTSDAGGVAGSKKSTTRRNAWGNMSYADLITQAILQSPEKRLTLSQVYEWMVQNVTYFRDKGDSNSSAGWKNSIRHNLSLHNRFMRIQNEGAGKSSWWVINPDAKPGRNPRRQRASTIDPASKSAIEKKRRGARKKVQDMRLMHSGVSSLAGSTASIMSHDIYGDDDIQGSFDPMFRPRTQSNLSVPGSSARVSPSMDHQAFDDFEFPPWVESSVPIPSDIVDRTDQMRLDACRSMMNGGGGGGGGSMKHDVKPIIKSEPVAPPPSYHELNSVRGPSQLQNPLLRNHQLAKFPAPGIPLYPSYSWGAQGTPHSTAQSCGIQQSVSAGNALPIDLENLTLPDQPLMEMDVESLLRHELSQTNDHQIKFDI